MTDFDLILTGPALTDIEKVKRYTRDTYGAQHAKAYDDLIKQALRDLRDDPTRLGSNARPEIHEAIRSYHIKLSRKRGNSPIKSPRHFVLYFTVSKDNALVISRILYDGMELIRHMPNEHKKMMEHASDPPPHKL